MRLNLKKILSYVLLLALLISVSFVFAADEVIERDDNRVPVSAGVTNDANTEIVMLRTDPTSKALIVTTSTVAPSSVTYTSARKVVTTAGTRVAISATTSTFADCDFQAEENNTGDIAIGGVGVVAALATRTGILLTPGTSWRPGYPGDLDAIYIDSEVNGDGIHYTCQS